MYPSARLDSTAFEDSGGMQVKLRRIQKQTFVELSKEVFTSPACTCIPQITIGDWTVLEKGVSALGEGEKPCHPNIR